MQQPLIDWLIIFKKLTLFSYNTTLIKHICYYKKKIFVYSFAIVIYFFVQIGSTIIIFHSNSFLSTSYTTLPSYSSQGTRSCRRIQSEPIRTGTRSLQKPPCYTPKSTRIRQGFHRNLCARKPCRNSKENDPVVSGRTRLLNNVGFHRTRLPEDNRLCMVSQQI